MRRVAGTALTIAAAFLSLMAILIDAPTLFFMSFALIALLITCNVQSALACKELRIERIAPRSVRVGESVTVEIMLWSERKLQRPLVTITDNLPEALSGTKIGPSLPVAPSYDLPVRTMYRFPALKRGRFSWKNVSVTATDAIGLTTKSMRYVTEPTEIIVLPVPIPVSIELPSSAGWGINEAQSGQSVGSGIEPRGVRPYAAGDSLRHVHWRSSARSGQLMVKEFQAGSHGSCAFLLQRTKGSDIGSGSISVLDVMCGHVLFIAEQLLRQGVTVALPNIEGTTRSNFDADRLEQIAARLGEVQGDSTTTIGEDLQRCLDEMGSGATIFVCVGVDDGSLDDVIQRYRASHTIVPLVYNPRAYDEMYRPSGPKMHGSSTSGSISDSSLHLRLRASGIYAIAMPDYRPDLATDDYHSDAGKKLTRRGAPAL